MTPACFHSAVRTVAEGRLRLDGDRASSYARRARLARRLGGVRRPPVPLAGVGPPPAQRLTRRKPSASCTASTSGATGRAPVGERDLRCAMAPCTRARGRRAARSLRLRPLRRSSTSLPTAARSSPRYRRDPAMRERAHRRAARRRRRRAGARGGRRRRPLPRRRRQLRRRGPGRRRRLPPQVRSSTTGGRGGVAILRATCPSSSWPTANPSPSTAASTTAAATGTATGTDTATGLTADPPLPVRRRQARRRVERRAGVRVDVEQRRVGERRAEAGRGGDHRGVVAAVGQRRGVHGEAAAAGGLGQRRRAARRWPRRRRRRRWPAGRGRPRPPRRARRAPARSARW